MVQKCAATMGVETMTHAQIEARIRFIQDRLSRVTHPQDIAACNRILEQLIMMEAEDDAE